MVGSARRRSLRIVASVALTTSAFAACGGDDDDATTSDEPSEETTTTTGEGAERESDDYIGLELAAAGEQADEEGRPWRVVKEDGEDLPVTLDFIENRLNFEVEDGEVVGVTTG